MRSSTLTKMMKTTMSLRIKRTNELAHKLIRYQILVSYQLCISVKLVIYMYQLSLCIMQDAGMQASGSLAHLGSGSTVNSWHTLRFLRSALQGDKTRVRKEQGGLERHTFHFHNSTKLIPNRVSLEKSTKRDNKGAICYMYLPTTNI